VKVRSANLE